MPAPVVFLDLAGPDAARLRDFYADVFDWPSQAGVPFAPGNTASLDVSIREAPAEKVIYLGVDDVSAYLAKVEGAGGIIDVPRFEVPGVAVLGLFLDPAGNRMGLVEMNGDQPVIP